MLQKRIKYWQLEPFHAIKLNVPPFPVAVKELCLPLEFSSQFHRNIWQQK